MTVRIICAVLARKISTRDNPAETKLTAKGLMIGVDPGIKDSDAYSRAVKDGGRRDQSAQGSSGLHANGISPGGGSDMSQHADLPVGRDVPDITSTRQHFHSVRRQIDHCEVKSSEVKQIHRAQALQHPIKLKGGRV